MNNKVKFLRGTATEYAASTKDNDTFYYTTDDEKLYLGNKEITGGGVTIDDTLSDTSKNPVQNKVINAALNTKANLTDIPTTLPADGGNSDTVGNKGISQILAVKGYFSGDMDDLKEQGSYIANEATNMPIPSGWGTVLVFAGGTGSVVQVFTAYVLSTSDLCKTYIRHFTGNLWSTWVNIADSGNADTVDGLHADDFVKTSHESWANQIQIPNDVDVPIWITNNAKLYTRYYTSGGNTGLTNNAGGNIDDWVWYYYDGLNIIATRNSTREVWIGCVINNSFSGWNLINGSNADTVDGKHASDFALKTDIPTTLPANGGNADTARHQIDHILGTGTDILSFAASDNCPHNVNTKVRIMHSPTCPTNYGYDAANNDFWYDIYKLDNSWVTIKAYDVRGNVEFMNSCLNGSWSGWARCNDNGNATTANTAGTLSATPSNICLRNISAGTADLSAGVSELATGAIYLVYE